jgi:hypothetical protein
MVLRDDEQRIGQLGVWPGTPECSQPILGEFPEVFERGT